MDGRREPPLSDDALDRELDAALSVEPSPAFVTRVRMRVAEQPATAAWWPRWRFASAGIGVTALAVAAALWSMDEPAPAARRIAQDVTLVPPVVSVAPEPGTAPAPVAVVARRPRPARVEERFREIALDDVIVSAEDRHGFEALLVAIEERRLPLLPQEEPGGDSQAPAPIEIPGVTIEPLEMLRLE